MLKLIKNADIYAPEHIGVRDILVSGGKIVSISEKIEVAAVGVDVEEYDAKEMRIIPGLIDAHVHICGGGGEGGFKTRTPELLLTDMIKAGVTTVVGCLGTDGVARSVENLVAKAKALKEEGVSAYCYSGSYSLPLTTITGDVRRDVMMIDEVVGLGEIAISDHRSSAPSTSELAKVASEGRLGGILSGKAGIINVHIGDGPQMLEPIYEVINQSNIPITQFLPTHINRNGSLFEEGIKYALRGGYVDITTSTAPQFIEAGEVPAGLSLKRLLDAGVSIDQITMTSDGQGSLPLFDENNVCVGLTVGTLESLFEAVMTSVNVHGISFETALKTITSTPAGILGLSGKGRIDKAVDADLVIINDEGKIVSVMAMGQWMMSDSNIIVKGTFE